MKTKFLSIILGGTMMLFVSSCGNNQEKDAAPAEDNAAVSSSAPVSNQAGINDNESQANVVKVAIGSKDHSTLVKAVQAADLVNALSNNGPFTVFAPTNAAFDALPKGTLDDLMKPEKKDALTSILYHHVQVSVYKTDMMKDGQVLTMFDGTPCTFHVKDGKYMIDDANIVASVIASNGIVHVIDKVLLPPAKK